MGVVDHDGKAGAVEPLETPGGRRDRRKPRGHRLGGDAERPGRGGGAEEVLHLGRADEACAERQRRAAEREHAARPRERRLDVERADIRRLAGADPHAARPDLAREPRPGGIVDVHHRHGLRLAARREVLEEEPRLGAVVALGVAVEVEMVATASKRQPSTRSWASACDDTSIATCVAPA